MLREVEDEDTGIGLLSIYIQHFVEIREARCTTAIRPGMDLCVPVWNGDSRCGSVEVLALLISISSGEGYFNVLTVPRHGYQGWVHGERSVGKCRLSQASYPSPSSAKYVRSLVAIVLDIQANRTGIMSFIHKNPSLIITSFQGCCISRSTASFKVSLPHRPRCPSPTFPSFQSPFKAFNASSNRHPVRGRSHRFRKKVTWISAQRLMPSFVQDRTSTLSARPRSTQRGLFASRWWLCWELRRLYPRTFSSNCYVTHSLSLLFNCLLTGEHLLENRTRPLLFFDSHMGCSFTCRTWILNSSYYRLHKSFLDFIIKSNRSGAYRTYRRSIRKTSKQQLRKSRWLQSSKFSVCNLLFISCPTDIAIVSP